MVSGVRRGPDRRTQERRHEEAALHYAEMNLLAAALTLAPLDPVGHDLTESLRSLRKAAQQYRWAADQLAAANREVGR